MAAAKISVLLHNLNRAAVLRRCLQSVAEQTHRPFEVVILDAGSSDSSLQVIENACSLMKTRGIEAKLVSCPKMGVAASRNFASQYASGDLLYYMDNDATLLGEDVLGTLARIFETEQRLGVVSLRILKADTSEIDETAWVFRRPVKPWAQRSFQTFVFTGGAFCIRAELFRNAGGFWQHLRYGREEEELGLFLIDQGWEILYTALASIRHYSDSTGRTSNAGRRVLILRNGLLVLWRCFPWPIALLTGLARVVTASLRTLNSELTNPLPLWGTIPEAFREWRSNHLCRRPVRYRSAWKYLHLHFRSQTELQSGVKAHDSKRLANPHPDLGRT